MLENLPAQTFAAGAWPCAQHAGWRLHRRPPPGHESAVRVELRRQDYNSLGFGQSCMETPIQLGQRKFKHGLATHANSEIVLHLPPGAKEFKAFAGIDNNFESSLNRKRRYLRFLRLSATSNPTPPAESRSTDPGSGTPTITPLTENSRTAGGPRHSPYRRVKS